MLGFIYKITNNINGKVYIGQTSRNITLRFSEHIRSKEKSLISRAIVKYGINNFSFEIVGLSNIKDLNAIETLLIKKFKSNKIGYNQCIGGKANRGYKHRKASKIKMSIAKTGKSLINSGNFIFKNPPKAIRGINIETKTILYFSSIREAWRNGYNGAHIAQCCQGKQLQHKGIIWEYYE